MISTKISVIIPCYNNAQFIHSAIDSVISQTYPNVEIIVIDDGSTDNSLEIIRSYEDIHWETGANQGAPQARNCGLQLAQGEFIKFLDADDRLLPDCLERQLEQSMSLQHQKAIVYGDADWIDGAGKQLPGYPVRLRQPGEDPIAHILTQNPLTSCPLHRKDYLEEIGGFDITLPRGQEYDLHLRLVLAGVEFVHFPGAVYQYRDHNAQRISTQGYSRNGPLTYFYILQKQQHAIEMKVGLPMSPKICQILAQRYWAYGRGVLRDGYAAEAKQYFAAARRLEPNHCIAGSQPYPFLVNLFGPIHAEKAAARLRSLTGRSA